MIHRARLDSPLGPLVVCSTDNAVTSVRFADGDVSIRRGPTTPLLHDVARSLERYWTRRLIRFDLPLETEGTPFQQKVWQALRAIEHGQRISYAELARRIGAPRAVRAAGRANGANPIAIFVPCHRVIGSDGTLTGYGGGLERKRALLELEGAL